MGKLKVTEADRWFSKCVRERAGWSCENCGKYYPPGRGRQGLDCSHFYGRGKWGVRFDPENASAHCVGCHRHLSAHPELHRRWVLEKMGQGRFELLEERAMDKRFARGMTKQIRAISKHYRNQHKKQLEWREDGNEGRAEFIAYV